LFVYGPRYSVQRKRTLVLIHFLSGTAKLVIWKTRKNKLLWQDAISVVPMFLGIVAARLKVEFVYYKLVGCLPKFVEIWCVNEVLCTLCERNELVLTF